MQHTIQYLIKLVMGKERRKLMHFSRSMNKALTLLRKSSSSMQRDLSND